MKNDHEYNDQNIAENQLDEEAQQEYSEEEHKELLRRRNKARKQFRSPLFIIGVIALLALLIVPRCMFEDNVRKNMERRAQQSEQGSKQNQQQQDLNEEESGMVPKF